MNIKMLIQNIRKRPGVFLGSEEITPLYHFLNGYEWAKYESNNCIFLIQDIIPLDFFYFSEYISIKTSAFNNLGWCRNILEYCDEDEHKALNYFFDFYDDFCEIKSEYIIKSVLTPENISCNNNMEHAYFVINEQKIPVYSEPISIYIFKLSFSAYFVAVETQKNIVCSRRLFTSIEKVLKELSYYFGEIKLGDKNIKSIEFGKNIIIE